MQYAGLFALIGLPMFFYANRPLTAFVGAMLVLLAAMLAGFRLGRRQIMNAAGSSGCWQDGQDNSGRQSAAKSMSLSQEQDYFRGVIDELSTMQNSDDLLVRYQSFISIVESTLSHSLGPCNISLWCLDSGNNNLVECVIEPTKRPPLSRLISSVENFRKKHVPCIVPLDCPVIQKSLEDRCAYLACEPGISTTASGRKAGVSLVSDGCIPLYRNYGQPVIVNVESTCGIKRVDKREEFHAAVKLVELFWRHLQAVNQRQWEMEHDSHSGALRDKEFLAQAQAWAEDCRQSDELFSLVVFTLRGFRRIFTNDSQQWRILSGIVGRCLNSILSANKGNCLLGKMADDVFAIMLRRSDEFLAGSAMHKMAEQLREAMEKDPDAEMLEVMAVEFQWAMADYKQYQGNVEQLLNKIYRRLFCQSQNKSEQIHQIVWEKQVDEVG